MAIDLQITGLEEVTRLLRAFPDSAREKYTKRAMKEAAEFIASALRYRVPKDTGTLRDSIKVGRVRYYASSGTMFVAVEPKSGFVRTFARKQIPQKTRRLSSKSSRGWNDAPVRRNPRKYLHLIEGGRDAVATYGHKLHPALGDKFFTHAKSVTGRPVFGPVAQQMSVPFFIAIENALNKAAAEFNATTTTT